MLYAIVAVIALILDQAVKYWTTVNIVADTGVKELIPGVLRLTNIHNTGAAFSFLEGARWFFVVLCVVFVALVIYALARDLIHTPVARWMAVIVVAGAVGNCIDRIVCGYVVDMFEFEFMRFPVFNVADICITVGAVAFALCVLFEKDGAAKAEKAKKQAIETPSGKTVPARKHEASPKRRSFKKTPIPDFPAHTSARQPQVDPNDPFAEWERRAAAAKAASAEKAAPAPEPQPAPQPAPRPVAQPAPQPPAKPAEVRPAAKAAPEREVKQPAGKPAEEVPVIRLAERKPEDAVPSAKAQADAHTIDAAADELNFDLDEILAEFKDL